MLKFASNGGHTASAVAALRNALLHVAPDTPMYPAYPDHVMDVESNLIDPHLLSKFRVAFEQGAGGELRDKVVAGKRQPAKMKAVRSSSALALNFFGPLRPHVTDLAVCGLNSFQSITFEKPFDAGLGRTPPHLDVFFENQSHSLAIEVKCLEYLARPKNAIATEYGGIPTTDARSKSPWFAHIRDLQPHAKALPYVWLHAAQLIKHYFGLAKYVPIDETSRITLLYLYWEPTNRDNVVVRQSDGRWVNPYQQHSDEVARFAQAVANDSETRIDFKWLSTLDLLNEWSRSANAPWLVEHAATLRKRYAMEVVPQSSPQNS